MLVPNYAIRCVSGRFIVARFVLLCKRGRYIVQGSRPICRIAIFDRDDYLTSEGTQIVRHQRPDLVPGQFAVSDAELGESDAGDTHLAVMGGEKLQTLLDIFQL